MVKLDRIEHTIELPEGVSATLDGITLKVNGPNGNLEREYHSSTLNSWSNLTKLSSRLTFQEEKTRHLLVLGTHTSTI